MLWENLREEEFEAAIRESEGLCLLPLGCLEKHGQHLPVGTDHFEASMITEEAVRREPAMRFPTPPWLGEVSCFHAFDDPGAFKYRGCIALKQETILSILYELCSEIARNGFNKILIVNGHGGNSALLRHFLRCQSYERHGYETFVTSAFAFSETAPKRLLKIIGSNKKDFSYLTDEDIKTLERFAESGTGGGHADIRETSLIMEYDETLVAPDRYFTESGASTHKCDRFIEAGIEGESFWLENYPSSYEAIAPVGASAAIGRAMKEMSVRRLANIIKLLKEK